MKKAFLFLCLMALMTCIGCTNRSKFTEGPLTTYSHEMFIKEGTGETGLIIQGEDWHVLLDLKDSEEV